MMQKYNIIKYAVGYIKTKFLNYKNRKDEVDRIIRDADGNLIKIMFAGLDSGYSKLEGEIGANIRKEHRLNVWKEYLNSAKIEGKK